MSQVTSGVINGVAAGTALAYSGSALINQLQLVCSGVTGATFVTFTVYDNNVAASGTAATGATWTGKSPGFSGVGPTPAGPTAIDIAPKFAQTARTGDQAGQTPPNTGGVAGATGPTYWNVTPGTGNVDYANTPVTKATVAALAITTVGSGSYLLLDNTNPVGNVVPVDTTAPVLYSVTLQAGQAASWIPTGAVGVQFGINIVVTAAGATVIAGSYNLMFTPLP